MPTIETMTGGEAIVATLEALGRAPRVRHRQRAQPADRRCDRHGRRWSRWSRCATSRARSMLPTATPGRRAASVWRSPARVPARRTRWVGCSRPSSPRLGCCCSPARWKPPRTARDGGRCTRPSAKSTCCARSAGTSPTSTTMPRSSRQCWRRRGTSRADDRSRAPSRCRSTCSTRPGRCVSASHTRRPCRLLLTPPSTEPSNCSEAATRPLLWAGGGVVSAGASAELTALAERLGAPVLTSVEGRGAIAEDHPLAIGPHGDLSVLDPVIADADVVLAIGTRFQLGNNVAKGMSIPGRLIHLDADPGVIDRFHPVDVAIVADARLGIEALLDAAPRRRSNRRRSDRRRVRRASPRKPARRRRPRARDAMGPDHEKMAEIIRGALPRDAVVVKDATVAVLRLGQPHAARLRTAHLGASGVDGDRARLDRWRSAPASARAAARCSCKATAD